MKIPRAGRWKAFPLIVVRIEAMFILGQRKA
jgi:hypothetical protein